MRESNLDSQLTEKIFTFYRNVKHLREQHGLSTKEFADIIEISEKKLILSEACTGVGYFYDVHIKNIYDHFHVKPSELFEGTFKCRGGVQSPPV